MIRLSNVKTTIDEDDLKKIVSNTLKIDDHQILGMDIVKRSIDARFHDVKFVYTFDVKTNVDEDLLIASIKNANHIPERKAWKPKRGSIPTKHRPVIVGAGPAGLFAALLLSEYGFRPLVIERGSKVDKRTHIVQHFFESGNLDINSNICFGEGGAGTFSDGKLKTRISNPMCYYVLKTLHDMGAPSDILYDAAPHVGTDILKVVIQNIRQKIINNGGEFIFDCTIDDIDIKDSHVVSLRHDDVIIEADCVILAIGHSAKDTYQMLHDRHVLLQQKPFAMGLRIEHPKKMIDKARYHDYAGHKKLGAASYSLNVDTAGGKAYTFCMCPGGVVVNAANQKNALSVNGMSRHKRDDINSNSAIVTQITPQQIANEHPLGGMYFQKVYEEKAFILGGENYHVPAMRVCDFLSANIPQRFDVQPSVMPKAVACDISKILPETAYETIKAAIPKMGEKLKGFDMGGAVLSGVESRTSSPVRILRGEDFASINVKGLYPAGEGAGYAGGIVSSAVDGLRVAEAIIQKHSPVK